MHNHIPADLLSPAERLDEVASILADGVQRLLIRKKQTKTSGREKVFVDFAAQGSSHVHNQNERRERT